MLAGIKKTLKYLIKNKLLFLLTVTAFILTLLPFVFDGQYGCVKAGCGMIIGTNYRDGVWFLAVAAAAFKTIPFRMPNFAGELLQGYHYLPNLITYLLSLVGIPITVTYYKLIPVFYMVALSLLATVLGRRIKDNPQFVFFFLFFVFFGMPLTLITSLYHFGYIKNQLLINTFQATRILEGTHLALSFLIVLAALLIIEKKTIRPRGRLLLGGLLLLTFGVKFYTGILLGLMIVVFEFLIFISEKKLRPYLLRGTWYIGCIGVSILLFYNPFNKASGGSVFVWAPFATVHHLIEEPSLFYNKNLVLARYFLYAHGWSPRLIAIEFFSVFLYVLFYFGLRVVGFFYIVKQTILRRLTRFEIVLTVGIIAGIIFSVLLIQKGDWFNPIQFAVVSAFLLNIFAARFIFEILIRNKPVGWLVFVGIFMITFPANLVNLGYLVNPARYVISTKEMLALDFLKKQPDGPVFYPIFENDLAYVSAFTGKSGYVNFTNVLENTGMPAKQRLAETQSADAINLDGLSVRYLYLPTVYPKHALLETRAKASSRYHEIYRNQEASVFEKRP
ncbi:hypothetical protein HY214_04950 [Candidatus Roizmanbacteria bacterium]|nr:hypothetical protein [Candidatus Roizmanbacteria bacterium]